MSVFDMIAGKMGLDPGQVTGQVQAIADHMGQTAANTEAIASRLAAIDAKQADAANGATWLQNAMVPLLRDIVARLDRLERLSTQSSAEPAPERAA